MDFLATLYNCDYCEAYRDIPSLTIEEAYSTCFNDLQKLHRAGIYGGKRHDNAARSLRKLSDLIVRFHMRQSGFDLVKASKFSCLRYIKLDNDS